MTKRKVGKKEKHAVRSESNVGGTISGSWYQKTFQGSVSTRARPERKHKQQKEMRKKAFQIESPDSILRGGKARDTFGA